GLALLEKVSVSPVGLARRAVSGVLAHRPETGPKHLRVDPPGVRKFAGRGLSVERTDGNAGVGFGGRRRVPRPLLASRIDRRARPFPLHASIVAYPPRTESPVAPLYNLVRDSAFPGATLHVRLPRPAPVDGDESAVRTGHVETRKRPEGRHRLEERRDRLRLRLAPAREARRLSPPDPGDPAGDASRAARAQFRIRREPDPPDLGRRARHARRALEKGRSARAPSSVRSLRVAKRGLPVRPGFTRREDPSDPVEVEAAGRRLSGRQEDRRCAPAPKTPESPRVPRGRLRRRRARAPLLGGPRTRRNAARAEGGPAPPGRPSRLRGPPPPPARAHRVFPASARRFGRAPPGSRQAEVPRAFGSRADRGPRSVPDDRSSHCGQQPRRRQTKI